MCSKSVQEWETGNGTIVDIAGMAGSHPGAFREVQQSGAVARWASLTKMWGLAIHLRKRRRKTGLTFLGFLVLFDPPKANIIDTIGQLKNLGVSLKVITGDNRLVAAKLAQQNRIVGDKHHHRSGPGAVER